MNTRSLESREGRAFAPTVGVTNPWKFATLVDRIRELYAADPSLSLYLSQLADRVDAPSYEVRAAIAALMSSGVVRWEADGSVVRADSMVTRPERRSA